MAVFLTCPLNGPFPPAPVPAQWDIQYWGLYICSPLQSQPKLKTLIQFSLHLLIESKKILTSRLNFVSLVYWGAQVMPDNALHWQQRGRWGRIWPIRGQDSSSDQWEAGMATVMTWLRVTLWNVNDRVCGQRKFQQQISDLATSLAKHHTNY